MTTTPPPVWLVRGDDTVLVEDAVTKLVDRLIGDDNRSETLDVFSGTDYELGAVVMAAETPSMFGRRVLVAREAPVVRVVRCRCGWLRWCRPISPCMKRRWAR